MSFENITEKILVADLPPKPQLNEELRAIMAQIKDKPLDVVLNMHAITKLNSANISQMLRLRTSLIHADHRLLLCNMNEGAWSVMLITGLNNVFEFVSDVPTAITQFQARFNSTV